MAGCSTSWRSGLAGARSSFAAAAAGCFAHSWRRRPPSVLYARLQGACGHGHCVFRTVKNTDLPLSLSLSSKLLLRFVLVVVVASCVVCCRRMWRRSGGDAGGDGDGDAGDGGGGEGGRGRRAGGGRLSSTLPSCCICCCRSSCSIANAGGSSSSNSSSVKGSSRSGLGSTGMLSALAASSTMRRSTCDKWSMPGSAQKCGQRRAYGERGITDVAVVRLHLYTYSSSIGRVLYDMASRLLVQLCLGCTSRNTCAALHHSRG